MLLSGRSSQNVRYSPAGRIQPPTTRPAGTVPYLLKAWSCASACHLRSRNSRRSEIYRLFCGRSHPTARFQTTPLPSHTYTISVPSVYRRRAAEYPCAKLFKLRVHRFPKQTVALILGLLRRSPPNKGDAAGCVQASLRSIPAWPIMRCPPSWSPSRIAYSSDTVTGDRLSVRLLLPLHQINLLLASTSDSVVFSCRKRTDSASISFGYHDFGNRQ